jgi:hypothetical protein
VAWPRVVRGTTTIGRSRLALPHSNLLELLSLIAFTMSSAVVNASRLKPDIRLAQAVSQFEAELATEQKDELRSQRAHLQSSPPDQSDVMRLTSEFDKTSGIVAGRRCFWARLTSFLNAVQQFAALGELVVGGSQNVVACGV